MGPNQHSSFTARGIVALVFSCITGILGVAVVVWYGLAGDVSATPGESYASSHGMIEPKKNDKLTSSPSGEKFQSRLGIQEQ